MTLSSTSAIPGNTTPDLSEMDFQPVGGASYPATPYNAHAFDSKKHVSSHSKTALVVTSLLIGSSAVGLGLWYNTQDAAQKETLRQAFQQSLTTCAAGVVPCAHMIREAATSAFNSLASSAPNIGAQIYTKIVHTLHLA